MRPVSLALICAAAILVIPAEASAFKYTHRVTATATLTDHWTVNDTRFCGDVGDGTFSAQLETTGSTRIRPFIDKVGSRPVENGVGLWILAVPGGGGYTHMRSRKAKGSITLVDNSVPTGPDCEPFAKRDCGTFPAKGSFISIGGYNPRKLYGNVNITSKYLNNVGDCLHGALGQWNWPRDVTGGDDKEGNMLFKMPSYKKFKKKRSLTLTKTDHMKSTTPYSNTVTYTDDVTRTITIKIEKL